MFENTQFEDSQIEIVPFYGEVIGCHSTGYQAAQLRLIPCNEIIQRFEAAEFIFIEVGSISIRLGKVAGRTKILAQVHNLTSMVRVSIRLTTFKP